MTRWFCKSSKLCGGEAPFRRFFGPEQCPFNDPTSLASDCSSSFEPPRLWRRFLPCMNRCLSRSFPFIKHSWCSDIVECLVIPTTEYWFSEWLIISLLWLLLHLESPGSIFIAPGTIVNLAGNAVGGALLNAAVFLGVGASTVLVVAQSFLPVDKLSKYGPVYPCPS